MRRLDYQNLPDTVDMQGASKTMTDTIYRASNNFDHRMVEAVG
jgi:hypothetical protein